MSAAVNGTSTVAEVHRLDLDERRQNVSFLCADKSRPWRRGGECPGRRLTVVLSIKGFHETVEIVEIVERPIVLIILARHTV
jgi:hypothetical protein